MEECAQCGKQDEADKIRLCSRCKAIGYCSRDCQKRHWACHKAECGTVVKDSERAHNKDSIQKTDETEAAGETTSPSDDGADVDVPLMTCHKCGLQRQGMNKCGSCLEVRYCSRDCQRADWKAHKAICRAVEKGAAGDCREKIQQKEVPSKTEKNKGVIGQSPRTESLSSSLSKTHLTSVSMSWDEARSRVMTLYPRHRIVDKFRELEMDFMGCVKKEMLVAVMKIGTVYPHFFRHGRCLEDAEGRSSYVLFHTPDDPRPYFRYEQLHEGNFLCYQRAFMHLFMDGTMGFRIDEARDVHILAPTEQPTNKKSTQGSPNPSFSAPATPTTTTQQWKEVTSKALTLFPGKRVVDSLQDIDRSELIMYVSVHPIIPAEWVNNENPTWRKGEMKATLLLRLESPLSHSLSHGWMVKDKKEQNAQLTFDNPESLLPPFKFKDLQKGCFVCVSHPCVTVDMECYAVSAQNRSSVGIIKL